MGTAHGQVRLPSLCGPGAWLPGAPGGFSVRGRRRIPVPELVGHGEGQGQAGVLADAAAAVRLTHARHVGQAQGLTGTVHGCTQVLPAHREMPSDWSGPAPGPRAERREGQGRAGRPWGARGWPSVQDIRPMLTKDTSLGLASRAGTILTAISVRVLPEAAQAQQGKRMPLELKKSRRHEGAGGSG